MLMVIITEGLAWLGLEAFDILMPQTELIPRTAQIYEEQSIYIENLLESQKEGSESALILDPDLGWRYRENYDSPMQRINHQGIRSDREYTRIAASGMLRIAVFGNSFAYGSEVPNSKAWSKQVETIFPKFEVLNYAVPGFGTDQAYLRYLREGQVLAPQFVIIGFAHVNLRRAVNVYRRFISTNELPLVKPRFTLDKQGKLELIPVPYKEVDDYKQLLERPQLTKELGNNDQWYSPAVYENPIYDWSATARLVINIGIVLNRKVFDPDRLLLGSILEDRIFNNKSLAFQIQSKILKKFYNTVLESDSTPIIMFFPGKDDIYRAQAGKQKTYDPLIEFLKLHNLDYIDCVETFIELPRILNVDQLFAPGGHYSIKANMIVAEFVGNKISEIKDTNAVKGLGP